MQNVNEQETKNKTPKRLSDLLDHFVEATKDQEQVSIGDLLDSLDSRSHGPMLLFPAIIAISPIGMVPGMSIVTGTLIILIATQMMLFTQRPWIPQRLTDFEFSREKLENGSEKTKRWGKWIETFVYRRLEFLTKGIAVYPVALICILLSLSFYPLALVPLGVFLPGLAVAMFALGLTARDGLLIVIGYALTLGAAATIWFSWPW
jgi:hypothetical protein